jgi:hypothetical protein
VKQSKKPLKKVAPARIVDLAAIQEGSQSIAFDGSQTTIYEREEVANRVGSLLDGKEDERPASLGVVPGVIDGMNWPNDWHDEPRKAEEEKIAREAGGRSDDSLRQSKVTAKPLPPIPPLPKISPPLKKPSLLPQSHMPVLGDLGGVGEDLGREDVCSLTQEVKQVPFTPEIEAPFDTKEVTVSSPFVTGNDRIDRRTAFTQFCRLGEGRTLERCSQIMGVPLESIKEWAKEDLWENAYRSQVTADVAQIAKEENIHEVLDIRREVIAQLKAKVMEAKNGKEVFKNTKELLDTMVKLEELTGAKNASGVRPGQIFIIISEDEWRAREAMNEKSRKEESERA